MFCTSEARLPQGHTDTVLTPQLRALLLALRSADSSASVPRLPGADSSLGDRYRCAAQLWELDFAELEITRRIGEGSFGEVLLANFRGTKVSAPKALARPACMADLLP